MELRKFILGLDVGIASVGWALIILSDDEKELLGILDLGVHTFNKGETEDGKSLNFERRDARGKRRVIRRRKHRLTRLKKYLIQKKLLDINKDFSDKKNLILNNPSELWLDKKKNKISKKNDFNIDYKNNVAIGVWGLRALGLEQKLTNLEWAHVLLHIVKHRGYLSTRKSENSSKESDQESKKILKSIQINSEFLKKQEYRTVAELAVKEFAFKNNHLRNRKNFYLHSFNRIDIKNELILLFEKQREFGNIYATKEIEKKVKDLLMSQRDAISKGDIDRLVAKCSLEPEEKRGPLNTYSYERFIWLTRLNNLKILHLGTERKLTEEEKELLINEPYLKSKITFSQVKKLLNLPDESIFNLVNYRKDNAENQTLMEFKFYHDIRKQLKKDGLKTEWESLTNNTKLLDKIGIAFSLNKTDDDIKKALENENISSNALDSLLNLEFRSFGNLSLKAINKLLPFLEKGLRYDEAVKEVYGEEYLDSNHKHKFLPKMNLKDLSNPVVKKSLMKTRKVINAIIEKYGSPAYIHIELARDLGKSKEIRNKIAKEQAKNEKYWKQLKENFKDDIKIDSNSIKRWMLDKYRLYCEQHCKCLYTGKYIDIDRLLEPNYVEIEHFIPKSRSWDNGIRNKILVLAGSNRDKGNKTPYEWLDGANNSKKWNNFIGFVKQTNFDESKKQYLLTKELTNGFLLRNLNDVRFISDYLAKFIRKNLILIGDKEIKVETPNGRVTSEIRKLWRLNKDRDLNNRHHALDAVVVACTTTGMIQKITNYYNRKEINPHSRVKLDIPMPWNNFNDEVMIRVFSDNPLKDLKDKYPERLEIIQENIRPLFISRLPQQKLTGKWYKDTLRSTKLLDQTGKSVSRVAITDIKIGDIKSIVGYENDREPLLYQAIEKRILNAMQGILGYIDIKKLEKIDKKDSNSLTKKEIDMIYAKAFEKPLYKPNKKGEDTQIVKYLRLYSQTMQNSGVKLDKLKAIIDNGSMLKAKVYKKNDKYYLVPVYAWQMSRNIEPNKAIKSGKKETEWDIIDDSYIFQFDLFPDDLIKINNSLGYYKTLDRSDGRIGLMKHDDIVHNKIKRVPTKTTKIFEKYNIDILGYIIK